MSGSVLGDRKWLSERVHALSEKDVVYYASFVQSRILQRMVQIVEAKNKEIEGYKKELSNARWAYEGIQEALNSGDGVYRP